MGWRSTLCTSIIAVSACSWWSVAVGGEAKPTTRPANVTYHDWYREAHVRFRQELLDAYFEVGSHEPRWDPSATAYLEAVAEFQACELVPAFYRPEKEPTAEQLAALGRQALADGCNDLLVHVVFAQLSPQEAKLSDEAILSLTKQLKSTPYPGHLAARVLQGEPTLGKWNSLTDRWQSRLMMHLWDGAMKKEVVDDFYRHDLWRLYVRPGSSSYLNAGLYQPPSDESLADPWLAKAMTAQSSLAEAWSARRSYRLDFNVPGDKQTKFEACVRRAGEAATQAYALRRDLPEPATTMIVVSAALEKRFEIEEWFDRALTAQIDFLPAYETMREMSQPRRGGTLDEMKLLAEACAGSRRYDTLVPFQALETLRLMDRESVVAPWTCLDQPAIYKLAEGVAAQYAAAVPQGHRQYFQSLRAAIAIRGNAPDDARTALDGLRSAGLTFDRAAFAYLEVPDPAMAAATIYLRTGPHWKAVNAAHNLAEAGNGREAARQIHALQTQIDADDPSRLALDRIAEGLSYGAGEQMRLSTRPDSRAWRDGAGKRAESDDGSSLVVSGDANLPAYCLVDGAAGKAEPGAAIEIEMTLTFLSPEGKGCGGLVFYEPVTQSLEFAIVDFGRKRAGVSVAGVRPKGTSVQVEKTCNLLVRCVDRKVSLKLDGHDIGEAVELGDAFTEPFSVGVGGMDGYPVAYSDVTFRRLGNGSDAAK